MARVDRETVGEIELCRRRPRELAALGEPQRWPHQPAGAEGGAAPAERAGDDERVAAPCAVSSRHALAAAGRGDRDRDGGGGGCVAADDRDAGLRDPPVELEHVIDLRVGRQRQRDEQRLRLGARRREIAEVDGGGAEAELAPTDPVEPEVDVLDQGVLGEHEPGDDRRVVLGPDDQPASLELREERKLTRL